MLLSTFLHIKGIGVKTEKYLWRQGFTTWDQYFVVDSRSKLFGGKEWASSQLATLYESKKAYLQGDMKFFAERLPKAFNYRVALSYPEETLFLDIETTGLSHHYDIVTLVGWSVGGSYGVWIKGQDESELFHALLKSKAIVTFNGSMFDLKFIEKTWPDIILPPIHIDLRYLAQRVGFSGGQKAIEERIGYKRRKKVQNVLGDAAPILWHQYRRGDREALKKLILYNHEDIEGMKRIFDFCVSKIITIESVPKEIRPSVKFCSLRSKIRWGKNKNKIEPIYIPKYSGEDKPLCTFERLNEIISLKDTIILGVDLVSSELRKSGCCVLSGNHALTRCLKTDEEIVNLAVDSGATLVSIDSPLSIPKGRTSFYDDDPFREHGIMRHCERTLKRRGINVYPCLIPSMQKLTRRGMVLAEKLRQKGIPVIESYPGAAQDIMMIPRKQAGLNHLIMGLKEFGIRGKFDNMSVSHDELDAITAAVVGLFFMTGKAEALGNPLEEYLIIPDLHGNSNSWLGRTVLGVENGLALPDQMVVDEMEKQRYVFLSLDEHEGIPVEKKEHVLRAESLAREMNMDINLLRKWRIKELMSELFLSGKIIVSGIRSYGDQASMFEMFGPRFKMIKSGSVNHLLHPEISMN